MGDPNAFPAARQVHVADEQVSRFDDAIGLVAGTTSEPDAIERLVLSFPNVVERIVPVEHAAPPEQAHANEHLQRFG
jgi:hypothetical protein